MKEYNVNITVYDPWANPKMVKHEYSIEVVNDLPKELFDAMVLAVAHNEFLDLSVTQLAKERSVIYDVKGMLNNKVVDGRL